VLLAACRPHAAVPDGAVVVDETVQLSRQPTSDTAARSLIVDDDSIIVAFADEQLTDVSLKLSAVDEDGKALDSVEVENHLAGAGIEIAALDVPEDARVTIRLDGTPDGISPGKVHLRVRQYRKAAQSQAEFQAQVRSAQAWSVATRSNMRPDSFRKSGLPNIDPAIAGTVKEHVLRRRLGRGGFVSRVRNRRLVNRCAGGRQPQICGLREGEL